MLLIYMQLTVLNCVYMTLINLIMHVIKKILLYYCTNGIAYMYADVNSDVCY